MAAKTDTEHIEGTRNIARFFTENRQISWVLLFAVLLWGVFGYTNIPKRKDPAITVRIAVATCNWPGVPAERVEQFVTSTIEQAFA